MPQDQDIQQRRLTTPLSDTLLHFLWFVKGALIAAAWLTGTTAVLGQELSTEVRERLHKSTVLVETWYREIGEPDAELQGPAQGSGFVIGREGLIITNAHCVAPYMVYDRRDSTTATDDTPVAERFVLALAEIRVRFHSGQPSTQVQVASVVCTRPMPTDLALLRIHPEKPLSTVSLLSDADFGKVTETTHVWAIGFPLGSAPETMLAGEPKLQRNPNGIDLSFRDGAIRALRRQADGTVKVIDHSGEITHGNSGGPLVDIQGRVVGVNYYGGETFSFAIPVTVLRQNFARLFKYRLHERAAQDHDENLVHAFSPPANNVDKDNLWYLLQSAVSGGQGQTVTLGEGDFQLDRLLNLTGSGLCLRGAGQGKTRLVLGPVGRLFCNSAWIEISDMTLVVPEPTGGIEYWKKHATSSEDSFRGSMQAVAHLRVHGREDSSVYLHDLTIETQDIAGLGIVHSGGIVEVTNVKLRTVQEQIVPSVIVFGSGEVLAGAQPRFINCSIQRAYNDNFATPTYLACRFHADGKAADGMVKVERGTHATVEACWFDVPEWDSGRASSKLAGIELRGGELIARDNLFDLWGSRGWHSRSAAMSICAEEFSSNSGIGLWPHTSGTILHNRFQVRRGPSSLDDLTWPESTQRTATVVPVQEHQSKSRCYNFAVGLRALPDRENSYASQEGWDIDDNLFDNTGWQCLFKSAGMPEGAKTAWERMMEGNTFSRTPSSGPYSNWAPETAFSK